MVNITELEASDWPRSREVSSWAVTRSSSAALRRGQTLEFTTEVGSCSQ